MADKSDINEKWEENDFTLRTASAHARQVRLIECDTSLSSTYGITSSSCMAQLPSFDATKSLPPDTMHDMHEGVIPLVLKHVIKTLITDGFFTLKLLNERLRSFPFQGNEKKSKPAPLTRQVIFGKYSIKGSASEVGCLFHMFSLLVGDLIPESSKAYEVYLLLRTIVDIVEAPRVTVDVLPFLQVHISDFYSLFRQVFPDVRVTPKMHYMIHYPRLFLLYGPLTRLSSIRFEAKHQFFKRLARKTQNFINICRTLSIRHQMHQTYHLYACKEHTTTNGCVQVAVERLPQELQAELAERNVTCADISTVQSLTVSRQTYNVGTVLPVTVFDDDLPVFAEIEMIILCENKHYLLCTLLRTVCFDEHFHAFHVEYTDDSIFLDNFKCKEDFPDSLYLHKVCNKVYINPAHCMFTGRDRSVYDEQ
ncbi:uncharacterized protein LOC135375886 [Ornithodoros turicata]|uniref:uncharacterized protein LOC135375886 n=1 Tax=Ornithodoros turicata TaxID=34597 RepID=UPI003139E4DC